MSVPLAVLRIERQGSLVQARIRGDIDMSNASEIREELSRATSNQAMGLLIDLSEVEYLDSAGLHMVHHLRENLRVSGQRLALVIPEESPVRATLRLAGIEWRDEIMPSVEEAGRALLPDEEG